jgi:ribosomal-protein-alanine N-acetyltransferase
MVARINLTQIARGPFQSAILGYAIDADHEGQGLMREAVSAVIAYAFGELKLHRLEANVRPENLRSLHLLERLGFERTGLAPRYLFIDGAWRDHVQHQRINPDFDDSTVTST